MQTADELAADVKRRAGSNRLLMLLDFDGTLCDFEADPAAVRLTEHRRQLLARLQQQATIGIVSGRRLHDVRERTGLDGLVVAGLHGLEIEGLGEQFVHPQLAAADMAVREIAGTLRELAAPLGGAFVEDKGPSVALHFRESDADAQRTAIDGFVAAAAPYLESGRLRLMRGSYVLELLPNIQWNKGDAVNWIRGKVEGRFAHSFVVYIGDDVTDQDAFAVVGTEGLPIAASDRVTADTRLDGPSGVEAFLEALAR